MRQCFCCSRNANTTHDMGMIFKYWLGKATPALFVCRKAKVSGTLSSLRVEESTSVIRSLVRPTQTLNSFMLHGCSEGPLGLVVGIKTLITHVCGARERGGRSEAIGMGRLKSCDGTYLSKGYAILCGIQYRNNSNTE